MSVVDLTGIPVARCPHCGRRQDCRGPEAGGAGGAPAPGDLFVCGACERMSVVAGPGVIRAPEAAELASITPGEWAMIGDCIEAIRAVKAAAGRTGRDPAPR